MLAVRSKPISRRLDKTTDAIIRHPGLSIMTMVLLATGAALFVAMYPELKRYILAKRM
jgi:hypothetical protein